MDIILEELSGGLPDKDELIRIVLRLFAASILGAIIGFERQRTGKEAGLRTHMLVCVGAALLIIAPIESKFNNDSLSRVIQGLVTGIGFLGGGAILKLTQTHEIKGLTTAAGIWMTSAIGITVGLGRIGLAILATFITWIILHVLELFAKHAARKKETKQPET